MSKIKSFKNSSLIGLENDINIWLRDEFGLNNNQIRVTAITHYHVCNNEINEYSALIIYEII